MSIELPCPRVFVKRNTLCVFNAAQRTDRRMDRSMLNYFYRKTNSNRKIVTSIGKWTPFVIHFNMFHVPHALLSSASLFTLAIIVANSILFHSLLILCFFIEEKLCSWKIHLKNLFTSHQNRVNIKQCQSFNLSVYRLNEGLFGKLCIPSKRQCHRQCYKKCLFHGVDAKKMVYLSTDSMTRVGSWYGVALL